VGDLDDHEDHQHDSWLSEDGDVALRAPPKRKGFLTHRKDDGNACDCWCCVFFQYVKAELPGDVAMSTGYEDCADKWTDANGQQQYSHVGQREEALRQGVKPPPTMPPPDADRVCYGTRDGVDPRSRRRVAVLVG
jgi:hypothetical protein